MKQQSRYKSLDFLRGIAVLMVITQHVFPGYAQTRFGWTGVDLFFVLSGFFVSGILFREYIQKKGMHGGRFFVRRALKIWPLFYAAFIIQFVYYTLKHQPPPLAHALAEVFFAQNYFPGFMLVTWSLGIEEQFYLLVALLLPLSARYAKVKWTVPACLFIMIIALGLRIIHYFRVPYYNAYTHHFPLQFRADALAGGIVISWYYHFHRDHFRQWVTKNATLIFIASSILLVPALIFPYTSRWIFTLGFTSIWLGYAGIVALLLFLPAVKPFWHYLFNKNKLMLSVAWVGFYSYAIYLFHFFIGLGALSNFRRHIWAEPPMVVQFLVFLTADIFFGFLISTAIEQPVLRWRNRVFPPKEKHSVRELQNVQ